tara:strand:+ start:1171 stop:1890 length:720 start_codon:yes stop_codon:yes gene_type:complete
MTKKNNSNPHNITNAVSPLKKRRSSYKGGTKVKRTATTGKTFAGTKMQDRSGGFGKSTATSNKAGYNINTSFRIPNKPERKDGTPPPAPTKPYTFGPDGGIIFKPQITVNGSTVNNNNANINQNNTGGTQSNTTETVTTTSERKLEGYDEFWNKRIKDKSKWSKGMLRYLNDVDMDDPDAVQKAKDEWERVSRKYEHVRNKNRKRSSSSSSSSTTKTTSSSSGGGSGGGSQTATINFGG